MALYCNTNNFSNTQYISWLHPLLLLPEPEKNSNQNLLAQSKEPTHQPLPKMENQLYKNQTQNEDNDEEAHLSKNKSNPKS